jgi:antitoxin YefM
MEASYTEARQKFASLLDRVTDERDIVYVRRRGRERVALVAADELAGLMETAHLLRSPKNAVRLLDALRRALGRTGRAHSVASLRREMRLERKG